MKITKQRLQEIILEEMRESQRFGTLDEDEAPKLDKTAARAGAQDLHKQGTGAVRDVAAMTPIEGQIEARLQALHNELVEKGEVENASRVKQVIDRVLKMVQSV